MLERSVRCGVVCCSAVHSRRVCPRAHTHTPLSIPLPSFLFLAILALPVFPQQHKGPRNPHPAFPSQCAIIISAPPRYGLASLRGSATNTKSRAPPRPHFGPHEPTTIRNRVVMLQEPPAVPSEGTLLGRLSGAQLLMRRLHFDKVSLAYLRVGIRARALGVWCGVGCGAEARVAETELLRRRCVVSVKRWCGVEAKRRWEVVAPRDGAFGSGMSR